MADTFLLSCSLISSPLVKMNRYSNSFSASAIRPVNTQT